ncbi:hypothetical protein MA16_Dca029096 [Dendrobium catenatum]|uniref:Uncharacterized protein n=1 Tax=Dendrobium catenatum TaxID=906689 RepID=A0A2I0V8V1_9ASPA|nr:hypothetical protein MA16_Dca029096 [Dendrobium catenatum]
MTGVDRRRSPSSNPSSTPIPTLKSRTGSRLVIRDQPVEEFAKGFSLEDIFYGKGKGLMVENIGDPEISGERSDSEN